MLSYKTIKCHIRGLTPTIMHNGQLANPINEITKRIKEITSSKPRGGVLSDDQALELSRLEWMGGLYVDESGAPCWPAEVLEAMLSAAARKFRQGDKAAIGMFVERDAPLIYDGPKDPAKLWLEEKYRKICLARIQKQRVMRCRPIFSAWELKFEVSVDPEHVDLGTFSKWLETAGARIGLSDWRPKFGRFEVLSVE